MTLSQAVARRIQLSAHSLLINTDAVIEVLGLHGRRIKEVVKGSDFDANADRVVIYAHYNPAGRITEVVFRLLDEYRRLGFAIVFVTMSKRLNEADRRKALGSCALFIRRRSFGRDFGAWKDSLKVARRQFRALKLLILTNDSILGPIQSMQPVFDRFDQIDADVVGLTDSWDRAYHLQSYFIVFKNPRAIEDAMTFFRRLFLRDDREWVIQNGEVGLTRKMLQYGLRIECLYKYREVLAEILEDSDMASEHFAHFPKLFAGVAPSTAMNNVLSLPINPTHYCWRFLIEKCGFPFIKVDLLSHNPSRIAGLASWREVVDRAGVTPSTLIERHLMTVDVKRVP